MKQKLALTTLAVLLLALPLQAAVNTGSADLSRYVALGDSLTAGYASGGLVMTYQLGSYPALLAQQAGVTDFELPLVSEPGIPPLLTLQHLVPNPVLVEASGTGMPINAELARPYNNLAVPGANVYDVLNTTGNIMNLLTGNIDPDTVMYDLILRDGEHTALEQAISLNPTFVTMFVGPNDVLGAAVYATPVDNITMTPVDQFEAEFQQALGALTSYTNADIVVFTVPYVTMIPFVNTIEPFITLPDGSHVPLIGSNGPLPEDARVTLGASSLLAQGIGIPAALGGTGQPLPEDLQLVDGNVVPGVVLRSEEVAVINGRIDAYNDVIRNTAAAMGAKVLEINPFLERVNQGYFVYGGIEVNADFLLGGFFSYDGIHPQNVGYAMFANYLINLINDEYRADIPDVNLYQILVEGAENDPPAAATSIDAKRVFTQEAFRGLQRAFPLLGPLNSQREISGHEIQVPSSKRELVH